MKRWLFRFDADENGASYWRWEEWDDDKCVRQSSQRFVEWGECVADATAHGYAQAEDSPPAPPHTDGQ